jgi:O-antigen/teichoic acid export membrane protein
MRMTAAAVCVNLVLNVVLIPRYGMHGAAWSTLITEAVRAGFARWCAATEHYPWTGLARRWKSLLAGSAMAAALWFTQLDSLPLAIALGALVYIAALLATGGIRLMRGAPPVLRV